MAVSVEALAMAGADYREWDLNIEEDSETDVPAHLLAEESEEEQQEKENKVHDQVVKAAADCDMRVLVGRAIESSVLHIAVLLKQLKL